MRSTPPHKALPCLPYPSYLSRAFLSLVDSESCLSPLTVVVVSHWDKLSLSPLGLWSHLGIFCSLCLHFLNTPLFFPLPGKPFLSFLSLLKSLLQGSLDPLYLPPFTVSPTKLSQSEWKNEYWGRQLFFVIDTPPPPG